MLSIATINDHTPPRAQRLLLSTKVAVPPTRSELLPRPRLTDLLSGRARRRLTLVSAPAGFGKTTLLSAWATEAFSPRVAWVSLEATDNSPLRFWSYVTAALAVLYPSLDDHAAALRDAAVLPALELFLTPLINEVARSPAEAVLILDDYHLLDDPEIHRGVVFLLEHLPPQVQLIISSRADPPLPLARLRARGQLAELRAAELRFTLDETAVFIRQALGVELNAADLAMIDSRIEGWITGLQLAVSCLQNRSELPPVGDTCITAQRYIIDYLFEEVLQQQPAAIQAFVLQTSILDQLSGPLCDAILEVGPGRLGDAQDRPFSSHMPQASSLMLEELERGNLFLVPLDRERRFYRYNQFFADMLRDRLQQQYPDQLVRLHLRAATWYANNGQVAEAMHHALAAGAPEYLSTLQALNPTQEIASSPLAHSSTQSLPDRLSERELEVLHLTATGASNREIASRIVVTLGTVKRHLHNIGGKLNAHSRTQMVARARELKLLNV